MATPERSTFSRILLRQLLDTEELREEYITTDNYLGLAVRGTPTSAARWSVVRVILDAGGLPARSLFKSDVIWDDRANASYWS